jgi:hypothetical protein
MLAIANVELIVCLLWVAYALVAISPVTLLLIGRPRQAPRTDLGPSRDQVALVLGHLWTVHSPKPPRSHARPLATA